ncbi:succinate dehydrogenase, hydrophobic membrane anchor protein [Arenimonas fontis]|uniref:Succinate dehydrogenase hydrophobic membrane anchor subunit n=1 Tax=Arenimonas fontis TaxID=2608255 RepID=A0A5B2Z8X2_9GAMM|nr:succinate dehydrogenase, hydrophobic membrane anchor protein [Arenimonas fontis]KAA2284439.1 succinate dehydrogenase, hydrophobic membrane anchor protein [Arenimonas fontis]
MSDLRNPLARAKGLGSAKDGVNHWWSQRLSAIALALLAPWFALFAASLAGADAETVRAAIARPWSASLLAAFVLALFWHARLGLQVVVEDYVHGWKELVLQLLIRFACALGAIVSLLAIGRIAFTA